MNLSRRSFFQLALLSGLAPRLWGSSPAVAKRRVRVLSRKRRTVDPWIEISKDALRHNTQQVSRLAGGRPILAVVKNNAYGLGLENASSILAKFPEIGGFAAVKASSCLKLREKGISKPVLLMGLTPNEHGIELIRHDIQLSAYTPDTVERLTPLARKAGKPASVHFYLDTGMGRMGMPYRKALPWMKTVASSPLISVEGTFMAFTEDQEFDLEQLERFKDLLGKAQSDRVPTGRIHAASSNGLYHLPEAHFDMVRPGIALFGAYPSRPDEERGKAALIPAFSLKTSVVRVARLEKGDSVSYGRNYIAEKPTWVATLSIGHGDGYARKAVDGAEVLIGDKLYPVIGAVSASHTLVEVGDNKTVDVGNTATLIGPEHPAIHPNNFADTVGVSVYDVLMHMNPDLDRVVI